MPKTAENKGTSNSVRVDSANVMHGTKEVRRINIKHLKEQELNAQEMPKHQFDALVRNIKNDGELQSLVYVHQPDGPDGEIRIISGHHRVRAAYKAGLNEVPCIVETAPLTTAQIRARQLAHNQIHGESDPKLVAQILEEIDDVIELTSTGFTDTELEELTNNTVHNEDTLSTDLGVLPTPTLDTLIVQVTPDTKKALETLQEQVFHATVDPNEALSNSIKTLKDAGLLDGNPTIAPVSQESYDAIAETLLEISKQAEIKNFGTALALCAAAAVEKYGINLNESGENTRNQGEN